MDVSCFTTYAIPYVPNPETQYCIDCNLYNMMNDKHHTQQCSKRQAARRKQAACKQAARSKQQKQAGSKQQAANKKQETTRDSPPQHSSGSGSRRNIFKTRSPLSTQLFGKFFTCLCSRCFNC